MEVDMKLMQLLFTLVVAALLFAACGPVPSANLAKSNFQREKNPSASSDDLAKLVDGNNAFALDLYQALHSSDGNLILSPYSISLALAMTYGGARGETESQMARTLHFDLDPSKLHPAFDALDLSLMESGKAQSKDAQPLQLNIANAVWAEQTYSFQQDYLDLLARNYGAGIHLADFVNQFEAARKDINNWVSGQTKDKIKDLIPQGALDAYTRMVLVNAIYFKADWEVQFDPNDTSDANFNLLDGSQTQVKMMKSDFFGLPYASEDGYQAIELAYSGGTAAMDIFVPDQGNFSAFESSLSAKKLDDIINNMQPASVSLGLPKFTYTSEFGLNDTLKSLGMSNAFDSNNADFSGMTGKKDLYISDVIHKAFVAVDEKGTEAAAATGVFMRTTAALVFDHTLIIDRPFIFVIRDLHTGQILFMGRVLNPAE